MFNLNRFRTKKVLIILTILEILFFVVFVIMFHLTFSYYVSVALDGLTEPWIGSNPVPIEDRYNVSLMKFYNEIANVSLIIWFVVNLIRFLIIDVKYRLLFLLGCVTIVFSFFMVTQDIKFVSYLGLITLGIGFVCVIWSHNINGNSEVNGYDEHGNEVGAQDVS